MESSRPSLEVHSHLARRETVWEDHSENSMYWGSFEMYLINLMDNELEINLLLRVIYSCLMMFDICWKRYSYHKECPALKLLRTWIKTKLHLDLPIFLKGNFIEHLAGFSSNGKKGLKIIWGDKCLLYKGSTSNLHKTNTTQHQ